MATNSSTTRTGRDGKAVLGGKLVKRLTQWTTNLASSETAWGDSDSAGYTNRAKARRDCTGTLTGRYDTGKKMKDVVREGDNIKIVLWENATDYWLFPCALIQGFDQTFDQDTQEVVEWTINFGADGIFYAPGETGASVETLPSS